MMFIIPCSSILLLHIYLVPRFKTFNLAVRSTRHSRVDDAPVRPDPSRIVSTVISTVGPACDPACMSLEPRYFCCSRTSISSFLLFSFPASMILNINRSHYPRSISSKSHSVVLSDCGLVFCPPFSGTCPSWSRVSGPS